MCHFAATKPNSDLDLVAIVNEAAHVPHLDLVVMIINVRSHLNFFNFNNFLFLPCLVLFLLFSVFELAKVENLAHGRIGSRRNLNQVKSGLLRDQ